MDTLKDMFEAAAGDEEIEFAVIGKHFSDAYGTNPDPNLPFNNAPLGKVMPWRLAKSFLLYEYSSGFGGIDCHPVYAWTKTRVLYVHDYDGSTTIDSLPRNPIDVMPKFGGCA
jgi:hypothetical protein